MFRFFFFFPVSFPGHFDFLPVLYEFNPFPKFSILSFDLTFLSCTNWKMSFWILLRSQERSWTVNYWSEWMTFRFLQIVFTEGINFNINVNWMNDDDFSLSLSLASNSQCIIQSHPIITELNGNEAQISGNGFWRG